MMSKSDSIIGGYDESVLIAYAELLLSAGPRAVQHCLPAPFCDQKPELMFHNALILSAVAQRGLPHQEEQCLKLKFFACE